MLQIGSHKSKESPAVVLLLILVVRETKVITPNVSYQEDFSPLDLRTSLGSKVDARTKPHSWGNLQHESHQLSQEHRQWNVLPSPLGLTRLTPTS